MNAALIAFSYLIARWLSKPLIHLMKYRVAPEAMPGSLGLDPAKPVVYVLPQRSWIDLFALQRICTDLGLPLPARISHSLPTPERAGLVYLPALLETFARNRAGDSELARMMAVAADRADYDIQIVPVSIFWGRDPGQETSLFKLIFADSVQAGRLRKILIGAANGRNVLANFGKPLGYREFLINAGAGSGHNSEQVVQKLARALPRALHFHFLRARTAALGPTLLRRSVVLKGVLESEGVRAAIIARARGDNSSLEKASIHARKCAEEVAADYSAATIRVMERVLTAIWNRVFKGVEVQGLERVRALAQSHEIVFMPSHRSHADYLLLSYVLYTAGLVPPHIAAGINLNFWPIGGLLRKCGAFYMRRKFSGDPVYTAVFRAYVDSLIRRGYSIEFFPEGGRSRTGRLLPPKTGLLAMVAESGLRSKSRKVALVPVFLGYDKVFEVGSFFKELKSGQKQRESAEGLLKATKILGKSYGRAYVNFGEPTILQDHADANLPGWREAMAADPNTRPDGFSKWVRGLAFEHMRRIQAASIASPVGLVACALLASPRRAATEDELVDQIAHFIDLLKPWPGGAELMLPNADPKSILAWAAPIARIQRVEHPWGDVLLAVGRDGVLMTYNRNNIQHLFAVPALIAAFFRTRGILSEELVLTGCRALYPFLRNEFLLPWPVSDCEPVARNYLERMLATGLLLRDADGRLRRPEVGDPAYSGFAALGRVLGETLERQAMAVLLLTEEKKRGGPVRREQFESDCRLLAERMAVLTGREAPEFFDKGLFAAYLDTLIEVGVVTTGAGGVLILDARCDRIAERSVELLSDETRQTLLQLLARRRGPSNAEPPSSEPAGGADASPGRPAEAVMTETDSGL
ncbi:glycerol-3-phosphate 1-O-acyltransferase PlsB [Nevskia ramosa]|uniref:glycerol-3-phosphate 1-O-acyltransferase PlsB n=1 Tax=Nevskia ramosa TaxID=64002 RepID=UPI003D0DA0D3